MRENLIKLDIFDVLAVTSYEAKHETGRHGRATIKAIIEEKREEEYVNAAKNTRWVRVDALDEADKESTIFYGLLEKICFFKESGSFLVELELITGSSLMEEKVHTRSFSKGAGEYTDILNILKEGYEEAHYITGEEGKGVIPSLLVQYRENDWNFIRRIAALKKTVLMPDYQSKGVKYFFGMPKRDTKVLTSQDVRIVVNKEYTVYEVRSREIHSLGDRVSFNRKDYRIVKIVSKTEGSELYHTYYLTQDIDYIVKKESKFDLKIIGASLYAKVTKVEKEKVKIAIEEIICISFPLLYIVKNIQICNAIIICSRTLFYLQHMSISKHPERLLYKLVIFMMSFWISWQWLIENSSCVLYEVLSIPNIGHGKLIVNTYCIDNAISNKANNIRSTLLIHKTCIL